MTDLMAETDVRWYDMDDPEGRTVRLLGPHHTDPGLEPRMERVYGSRRRLAPSTFWQSSILSYGR